MTMIYLWINAALYAVFAIMCATRVKATARSIGYPSLTPSGVSEYLTVYGGLQVGLAAFFAWTAYQPALHAIGLIFALCLYAPIVLFRWASVLRQWPVTAMTLSIGILEAGLLAAAIVLWWLER